METKPVRVVYFGTSSFAVPSLEALAHDERFSVIGVVTQPDRLAGRKNEPTKPAIKVAAEVLDIPILQFESLKSEHVLDTLRELGGDVAVVASYGQIIPQSILDLYPHGAVNVHGSVLPDYRGASPIAAAIRDGRTETGVSIMLMDAQVDHGPVLSIMTEPILNDDTAESLTKRLAVTGARILPDVLADHVAGKLKPKEQNHDKATFVKLLSREDGRLDPSKQTAMEMEALVRAYFPWPGTFLEMEGKRLKILEARVGKEQGYPEITGKDGGIMSLIKVQPEGGKPMSGVEYTRGRQPRSPSK